MKKLLSIVIALVMCLTLVAACSKSGNDAKTDSTKAGEADSGKAESGKVIKLSVFAGSLPENTPTGEGVKKMVEEINAKSNGTLEATAYFDTSLGDATSMVQGLQQGTIDIGVAGNAYFSGLVPQIQVFELPFLFENIDQARAAVDGPAKDEVGKLLNEKGVVLLRFWEGGMRQLSNNVRNVKTPDDLKGIKMRTLPSKIQSEAWKALGALPTSIDAAELYTALQQGTVSAQENPLYEIVFRKFYEVQNHITLTSHVYTPFCMGMSKMTYDKLNDEQKKIVMEAAEAGQKVQREANDKAETTAVKTLEDNKVEIEKNPDRAKFVELTQPVWKIFTDEYGTDILDLIKK